MSLFSILLLGHLIADFPFQTPTILRWKFRGGFWIGPHVLVHTAVLLLILDNPFQQLPVIGAIIGSHFVIDWVKVAKGCVVGDGHSFLLDQVAHIVVLWLAAERASTTSDQFVFDYRPLALGLGVMSAVFMYLNVAQAERETLPAPDVMSRYAFHISKVTGWLAAVSLVYYVPFVR